MKRIILLRHAKSSWSNPSNSDFERPLNNRGVEDAHLMATKLREKIGGVDLILSSTANRAKSTTEIFISEGGIEAKNVKYTDKLYHASTIHIMTMVSQVGNAVDSLMVVAHNPSLTDLTNQLTNISLDNLPTSGTVVIDFDLNDWNNIMGKQGELLFIDFPKLYKKKKLYER